jgi:hypothetical protein
MTNEPVRLAARIISVASLLIPLIIQGLVQFEIIDPTVTQLQWLNVFTGAVIASAAYVFGVQVRKIVTPVANPSDGASPLVPTAADGYEDPEVFIEDQ